MANEKSTAWDLDVRAFVSVYLEGREGQAREAFAQTALRVAMEMADAVQLGRHERAAKVIQAARTLPPKPLPKTLPIGTRAGDDDVALSVLMLAEHEGDGMLVYTGFWRSGHGFYRPIEIDWSSVAERDHRRGP